MKKGYEAYVNKATKEHSKVKNVLGAWFAGGLICAMAQCMNTLYSELLGANDKEAAAMVTLTLIVLSVILTGTGHFKKIAKWAGAGVLVPITGFANSVAAPAIEFKKEGWVYGTGCKIFTIAGPVILYGVACSTLLGVLRVMLNILW